MIPVLVLTHGNLASELLHAAQTIDPNLNNEAAAAMSLPWDVDSDEAARSLKKQLRELDHGDEAGHGRKGQGGEEQQHDHQRDQPAPAVGSRGSWMVIDMLDNWRRAGRRIG